MVGLRILREEEMAKTTLAQYRIKHLKCCEHMLLIFLWAKCIDFDPLWVQWLD